MRVFLGSRQSSASTQALPFSAKLKFSLERFEVMVSRISWRELEVRQIAACFVLCSILFSQIAGPTLAAENVCGNATPAQCEITEILESSQRGLGLHMAGDKNDYLVDDAIVFDIIVEDRASYLTISYIASDDAVHIIGAIDGPFAPGSSLRFGDGSPGAGTFFVSEPFGSDMVLAIATDEPILNYESGGSVLFERFVSDLDALFQNKKVKSSAFAIISTRNGAF